jgi:hypothetical protein
MEIVCPGCRNKSQGPTALVGKKIRCKKCGEVFGVPAPKAKKAAPAKGAPAKKKPEEEPPVLALVEDEEDDSNPYGVTDLDLTPRCPHCANEMDEGAIICLHCGYNTLTRERFMTTKVVAHTGGEIFLWWLPAIACILTALLFIGAIVFMWVKFDDLSKAYDAEWYGGFFGLWAKLWGSVIACFVIFFSGRFAFKRLVLHTWPPEKVKH